MLNLLNSFMNMKKNYIAPQMVETEIILRSCICSGGFSGSSDTDHNPQDGIGGEAPKRLGKMYI